MLKWVNGLTTIWQKFQGIDADDEERESTEDQAAAEQEELDFKAAIPVTSLSEEKDSTAVVSVPTWIPQMKEDAPKEAVVELDEIDAILNMTREDVGGTGGEVAGRTVTKEVGRQNEVGRQSSIFGSQTDDDGRQNEVRRQSGILGSKTDDDCDESNNANLEKSGSSLIARHSEMSTGEFKKPENCCNIL